ncbi:hypothetical protein NSE_0419 [Neorickettsia sennetsu str. Miyayama]|uniref:Uncharacterized protein n=1 Tax=Ehrlichia sennetsu (strain ATCC VR-367 / Miyayama) TaxID=222891 RepID=Q2GDZ1_EHRS3|nr:hypothetical protein NSE_0419 [Neorickettsia sennetsu str. Miyayama]
MHILASDELGTFVLFVKRNLTFATMGLPLECSGILMVKDIFYLGIQNAFFIPRKCLVCYKLV